jgi:hypothetical protein
MSGAFGECSTRGIISRVGQSGFHSPAATLHSPWHWDAHGNSWLCLRSLWKFSEWSCPSTQCCTLCAGMIWGWTEREGPQSDAPTPARDVPTLSAPGAGGGGGEMGGKGKPEADKASVKEPD